MHDYGWRSPTSEGSSCREFSLSSGDSVVSEAEAFELLARDPWQEDDWVSFAARLSAESSSEVATNIRSRRCWRKPSEADESAPNSVAPQADDSSSITGTDEEAADGSEKSSLSNSDAASDSSRLARLHRRQQSARSSASSEQEENGQRTEESGTTTAGVSPSRGRTGFESCHEEVAQTAHPLETASSCPAAGVPDSTVFLRIFLW